jgi:hypothetical protein
MGKKATANDCIMALAKQQDPLDVGLGRPHHRNSSFRAAPSDVDDPDEEEEEEESFSCKSSPSPSPSTKK